MGKTVAIIIGVILTGGILGFLVLQAVKRQPPATTDVAPARADVLQSDVAEKIKIREINGQVPVPVVPENYGRDDPFANF
jgi:hypothetical protein